MSQYKIIIEKHSDGYVAYPLGLKGVVVGQGDTYEEALFDVKSAMKFHIETFGNTTIKTSTLRTICNQTGISRDDFIDAYKKS